MHTRKSLEYRYACMLPTHHALDCQAPCAPLTPSITHQHNHQPLNTVPHTYTESTYLT
jgi:hypothetical protein